MSGISLSPGASSMELRKLILCTCQGSTTQDPWEEKINGTADESTPVGSSPEVPQVVGFTEYWPFLHHDLLSEWWVI